MKRSDSLLYKLTKAQVIIIFAYYFLVLLVGSIITIYVICNLDQAMTQNQLMIKTIASSLSISGMLCSLQYTKRMYKACITERIVLIRTFVENLGNLIYFLLRPFFAFVFVIVMIFALLSGMFVVTGSLDYITNEKFLYLCGMLSSFIGFSVGQLLDKFEIISKEKIDEIK